jgi:hypothetical protein
MFGEPIETLRGSSELLGEVKGGLPAYHLWANEVFLVAYVKGVRAFPEKSPERSQVALPSKVLLNSLSQW